MTTIFHARKIDKVVPSKWQSLGKGGGMVRRSIPSYDALPSFDPFLLLDEFNTRVPQWIPEHPHRGLSLVTYLFPSSPGSFQHEDNLGNRGVLKPGGLHWMMCGRGMVHCLAPMDEKPAHGLQLWINLPKSHKMSPPSYHKKGWESIPHAKQNIGMDVAVLSGSSLGVSTPIMTVTPIDFLYVKLEPGVVFEQPCDSTWNALIYTIHGSVVLGDTKVGPHTTVTFTAEIGTSGVRVVGGDEGPAEFCFLTGEPIEEPLAQGGPMVMNTHEELLQALADYRMGRNGFEGAREWSSEIAKTIL